MVCVRLLQKAAGFPPVPRRKDQKRAFDRESIPLKFTFEKTELTDVRFSVTKKALPDLEEWLGIDHIKISGEEILAEATLPAGEVLLSKILSFGNDLRVLSPSMLADEVKARAEKICRQYDSK